MWGTILAPGGETPALRRGEVKQAAIDIIRELRTRGHEAYLVGGCVRDLILGREPADYDVATNARPDEVMRIFPRTFAVGAQFGVVLVPIKGESQFARDDDAPLTVEQLPLPHAKVIEVATFRSDGLYTDGRHP